MEGVGSGRLSPVRYIFDQSGAGIQTIALLNRCLPFLRLAQVHSLEQSTIRVIQHRVRSFLNRERQTDGKNGLVQFGLLDFQTHSFC